jgi:hypothetical protein
MIAWCENGPRGAVVRGVEVAWEEATGEGNGGFLVR